VFFLLASPSDCPPSHHRNSPQPCMVCLFIHIPLNSPNADLPFCYLGAVTYPGAQFYVREDCSFSHLHFLSPRVYTDGMCPNSDYWGRQYFSRHCLLPRCLSRSILRCFAP
jgi:hypothetical protein